VVVVAIVLSLAALVNAQALTDEQHEWLFGRWMEQHQKVYSAEESVHRFQIWKANMNHITKHNGREGVSYKLGMNQFGDLTGDEWKQLLGIRRIQDRDQRRQTDGIKITPFQAPTATPPATWDWRTKNAVNPIQNQGQCGSCWAFTAGDSISGLWAIKTGLLFPVSVQEIVDCSGPQGNQGCNGGLPDQAFQFVVAQGGICDWQEYQYTAQTGTCMAANCTAVATISGLTDVPTLDEAALMAATWGTVVSTAVEADQSVFQFYTSGIIDDPTCGDQLDHGMTVVGWGTDAGKDYWELRNMWGTSWGEEGYVRVVRGKNMCGLATEPSYPTYTL